MVVPMLLFWSHSKEVTTASTYARVHPLRKAKRVSSQHKLRIDTDPPKVVQNYDYRMSGSESLGSNSGMLYDSA